MLRFIAAKFPWLAVPAVLLITGCIYWAGLSGSFMFDDNPNIVDDTTLRLFDGSISSLAAASAGGVSGPLGRPLSLASFAFNIYFFGTQPFSFKLINLLIHLANGILVFMLVRQLWPRLTNDSNRDRPSIAAMWIMTVWLLHPINLTAVLFVVQRMTSLSAFFTLAALCLYLYGRQIKGIKSWTAIAASLLLCWPAAILSKETGVLLPVFIFVCEWLALGSFDTIPRKIRWFWMLAISLAGTALLMAKWDFLTGGYASRNFGLLERLMTEARVLWFYLLQILLPWGDLFSLHHDDIPVSHGLLSPPQTLYAIAGWILLIGLAIVRRKRSPLFCFAVVWFLVAHALESTIVPLEIAYEHRNYLASLGILMWLASMLFPVTESQQGKMPRPAVAACFVLYCALVTGLRSMQWADEYRRTQIEATVHPNSTRAHYEAALAVVDRVSGLVADNIPAYQKARFHFNRAAELDQNGKDAVMGLVYLDCLAGAPKDVSLQLKLRERFAKTRLSPRDMTVVQSLSGLLIGKRLCLEDDEVKALLGAALSNPAAIGAKRAALYTVAMDYAAAKIHSLPMALNYARAAVDSDPNSAVLRINLTHLLLASGDMVASRREYTTLVKMHIALRDKAGFEALSQKIMRMEKDANKS